MKTKEVKPKRKYWYKFHCYECVECGSCDEYKWRVYEDEFPKPATYEERHEYTQYSCGNHY
jgi:hypothetical protein